MKRAKMKMNEERPAHVAQLLLVGVLVTGKAHEDDHVMAAWPSQLTNFLVSEGRNNGLFPWKKKKKDSKRTKKKLIH